MVKEYNQIKIKLQPVRPHNQSAHNDILKEQTIHVSSSNALFLQEEKKRSHPNIILISCGISHKG